MKKIAVLFVLSHLVIAAAHAQEAMTGPFRMSHTVGEILGDQVAQALRETIAPDEPLQWQVYVPFSYDPSQPAGVFIYLDPNRYGGIPDKWMALFNEHNLIWVGPRVTDRREDAEKAVWHAVLGLRAIEAEYAVDLNRVYIGSSRDTTVNAFFTSLTANEIKGAVYIRGSAMWRSIEPDQLEQIRRKRYVFITGTNDEAREQVRSHYEAYKEAGVGNVKLIYDTRRIEEVPEPEQMDEAIRFLDGG